jgi:Tol biopolymer transport system component
MKRGPVNRKRWIIVCVAAGVLLAVGIGAWVLVKTVPGVARLVYGDPPTPTAGPAPATVTGKPEWIAFETQRGSFGDYEIFVMAPDGSRLTNLTNSWADDVAPAWSADGRHVAFVSVRDTFSGKLELESGEIYVLDFDPLTGRAVGEARRLTDSPAADGWPVWSPSGDQIAFHSNRGGDFDIWVMNADGSNPVNLTNHPGDDKYPAWSPAPPYGGAGGSKIAFASDRDGSYDIWVMNTDGSNLVKLTDSPARDRYPIWSPAPPEGGTGGARLTFNTDRDGNQEIYIMDAAPPGSGTSGSDPLNVTNTPYIEGLADWSPDGTRLVLYSEQKKDKDVYILDLATGQWTNITNSPYSDEYCAWWP